MITGKSISLRVTRGKLQFGLRDTDTGSTGYKNSACMISISTQTTDTSLGSDTSTFRQSFSPTEGY